MRKLASVAAMAAMMVTIGVGSVKAKAFAIPHVLEGRGNTSENTYTFDTSLFFTYTTGLGGDATAPTTADIEVYLFDKTTGNAMTAEGGGEVCNPCTINLDSTKRKQTLSVDAKIVAAGGFNAGIKVGHGVIVVKGDVDGVSMQGFVVNSLEQPALSLSVFGFAPPEVKSTQ